MHVRLQCPCWLRVDVSAHVFCMSECRHSVVSAIGVGFPLFQGIVAMAMQRCDTWHWILNNFFTFDADWPMLQITSLTSVCIHTGSYIEGWTTSLTWRTTSSVLHHKHHKMGIADMHPGLWTVNRSCPLHLWAAEEEAVLRAEMVPRGRYRVLPNPKPHFHTIARAQLDRSGNVGPHRSKTY